MLVGSLKNRGGLIVLSPIVLHTIVFHFCFAVRRKVHYAPGGVVVEEVVSTSEGPQLPRGLGLRRRRRLARPPPISWEGRRRILGWGGPLLQHPPVAAAAAVNQRRRRPPGSEGRAAAGRKRSSMGDDAKEPLLLLLHTTYKECTFLGHSVVSILFPRHAARSFVVSRSQGPPLGHVPPLACC